MKLRALVTSCLPALLTLACGSPSDSSEDNRSAASLGNATDESAEDYSLEAAAPNVALTAPTSWVSRRAIPLKTKVRAMTWDGRVAFSCDGLNVDVRRCYTKIFRPAQLRGTNSPDFTNAWSPDFALTNLQGQAITSATDINIHLAAAMNPTVDYPQGNPYRCALGGGAEPLGEYECYKVMIVAYTANENVVFAGTFKGLTADVVVHAWEKLTDGSLRRRGAPYAAKFETSTGWVQMASGGAAFRDSFEPAVTADGRLLFTNNGRYYTNTSQGSFGAFAASWSGRKLVHNLVNESDAFKDRYPIARQRWRDALGRTCTSEADVCGGFYPWVSPDGADLFFTKGEVFEQGTELESRNLFMVSPRTGYREVHVDAVPNRDRMEFIGTPQAFGAATGTMWHQFPEVPANVPFPYTKGRSVYPLIGKNNYGELDLQPFSADYTIYLPMNELMTGRGQAFSGGGEFQRIDGRYTAVRTGRPISHKLVPDVSGNFHTGQMNDGAHFPQEYFIARPSELANYAAEDVGSIGKGVFLQPGGAVIIHSSRVADVNPFAVNPADIQRDHPSFTVEVDYQVLAATGEETRLVTRENMWTIFRHADGRLGARFMLKDGTAKVILSEYKLAVSTANWYRIAVVVTTKSLFMMVNGTRVLSLEEEWLDRRILSAQGDLYVGHRVGATTGPAILIVDEFGLSNRARSGDFLQTRSGFRAPWDNLTIKDLEAEGIPLPSELTPPLGFKTSDLSIPFQLKDVLVDRKFSQLAALGDELFHDTKLTGKKISCSTCHNSDRDFIDTRVGGNGKRVRFSPGALPGTVGSRNSPVAFNRAFSTAQFADGRAKSLYKQVSAPILNPNEMAGEETAVLDYLRANYLERFKAIFVTGPTTARLSLALSAYVLTQMQGNSTFDRLQGGDRSGITNDELLRLTRGLALFNGKARCSSCHSGPNFSDEQFHNTGTTVSASGGFDDIGRELVTHVAKDKGALKTPSLRHIKNTAPYFADSQFYSLDDVVKFYERGGVRNSALDHEVMPFTLTTQERSDLILFLNNL